MATRLEPRNPLVGEPAPSDRLSVPPSIRSGKVLRVLFVMLGIALLLRIIAIIQAPLAPEEAYYWMYAQHPSLSYFDHPPMVAWVIGAGTKLFGHNEWGVRIVGHLMMLAATVLLYVFGRIWFGRREGLLAAVMLHVLPVYFGIGLIATMDSALLLFWMLGLVGASLALKCGQARGWYLAGVGLGGALLSKYTGVFLVAGIGMAVVLHRPWRRWLLSPHPYIASLLGFAMFTPVIVWNARHDWASFQFQFGNRWDEAEGGLRNLYGFLGSQAVVATPVLLAGVGVMLIRLSRRRRWLRARWLLPLCCAMPLLLVMLQKSFTHEIHINWTVPAYVCLMPAMARLLRVDHRRRRQLARPTRWTGSLLWTAGICSAINIGLLGYVLLIQPRTHQMTPFGPWRDLAAEAARYADRLQAETGHEPLIVANGKYRLASELAFYRTPLETDCRAADFTTSQWYLDGSAGLGYVYWETTDRWAQSTVLYVCEQKYLERAKAVFDTVDVVYDSQRRYPKRYLIAVCRGHHAPTTRPAVPVTD